MGRFAVFGFYGGRRRARPAGRRQRAANARAAGHDVAAPGRQRRAVSRDGRHAAARRLYRRRGSVAEGRGGRRPCTSAAASRGGGYFGPVLWRARHAGGRRRQRALAADGFAARAALRRGRQAAQRWPAGAAHRRRHAGSRPRPPTTTSRRTFATIPRTITRTIRGLTKAPEGVRARASRPREEERGGGRIGHFSSVERRAFFLGALLPDLVDKPLFYIPFWLTGRRGGAAGDPLRHPPVRAHRPVSCRPWSSPHGITRFTGRTRGRHRRHHPLGPRLSRPLDGGWGRCSGRSSDGTFRLIRSGVSASIWRPSSTPSRWPASCSAPRSSGGTIGERGPVQRTGESRRAPTAAGG